MRAILQYLQLDDFSHATTKSSSSSSSGSTTKPTTCYIEASLLALDLGGSIFYIGRGK